MKNQQVFLALVIMCLFSFCKNNDDEDLIPVPIIPIDNGIMLTTTIGGFVFDESDEPVSNAEVKLGTLMTTTDLNGIFIFKDIQTNSKDTYLSIEKEGYLHSSKRVYPFENATLSLRFKLLPKTIIGTISSATGGEVSLNNGSKIFLPANGVQLANGNIYSGNVNVTMHHLDPLERDLINKMPGDLTGINTEGNLQVLESFGMLGVELSSDNGELLQVADGKEATLTFPVVSGQSSTAPETIPLWYFDEENGRWMEEGSATKEGETYVGTVSHFSFWNCDIPRNFVFINGKLIDTQNNPVADFNLKITSQNAGIAYGSTNSNGEYGGFMPKDQNLNFELLPNNEFCNEGLLYEDDYGPFSQDTEIEDIIIIWNPGSVVFVHGNVIGCNGVDINNGYLKLLADNRVDFIFPTGNVFSKFYAECDFNQLFITGYDLDNQKVSAPLSFDFQNDINTGVIEVCDQGLSEYIIYTLDGESYVHENPLLYKSEDQSVIIGNQEDSLITLIIDAASTGTFNLNSQSYIHSSTIGFNGNIEVNILSYGGEGELITGVFQGTHLSQSGERYIEGSFNFTNNITDISSNCPIPETWFTGSYLIESVVGNENCFGDIFTVNQVVELTYFSESERRVDLEYLPAIGPFTTDMYIDFSCGKTYIPIIDSGVGCSSSILLTGGDPLEEYDENNDTEFQINMIDFINQDCGCPTVYGNIYKFTKQ